MRPRLSELVEKWRRYHVYVEHACIRTSTLSKQCISFNSQPIIFILGSLKRGYNYLSNALFTLTIGWKMSTHVFNINKYAFHPLFRILKYFLHCPFQNKTVFTLNALLYYGELAWQQLPFFKNLSKSSGILYPRSESAAIHVRILRKHSCERRRFWLSKTGLLLKIGWEITEMQAVKFYV